MRILRICTCAAFAVILAVFLFFYIREERNTDATWPVITIEEQLIDVSLRPTDEELMKGITAYDGKDGDIPDLPSPVSVRLPMRSATAISTFPWPQGKYDISGIHPRSFI